MLNRIFSILGSQWLIHQDSAISYLPVLIAFVKGQEILLKETDDKKPFVMASLGPGQPINTVQRWYLDDPNLPDNSVGIIPVEGPITSWDSSRLIMFLKMADQNPKINSILLWVDSPGGMVSGMEVLTDTIKGLSKPTVSLISGMAASAAMWIISATKYRIATSRIDFVGSIGTKVSLQDFSGLLEKIGIKMEDFFATKATRKEEEFRAWQKGDTAPVMAIVDFINEIFHEAIRTNLNISADSEVFTGAIYFAEKAKELGLINEINTVDYAIEYAYQLGLKHKITIQSNQFKL